MTPGARIQATIELIEQILVSWQSEKRIPADKLLEYYFKSHRYIGSKDRGGISELTYWILRHKASLEWWLARNKQESMARPMVLAALILRKEYTPTSIQSIFKDSQYSPAPPMPDEEAFIAKLSGFDIEHSEMPDHIRLNYPEWMDELLHNLFGDQFELALHALGDQAPADLRANTLKTTRDQLLKDLKKEGFECTPTEVSPIGIRLAKRAPVFTSPLFKAGHFEMQDEGSQIVSILADAEPGQKVIDFCAGAGGKTLAMAASMKNKGRILAWDTSEKRLSQLPLRLKRAGVDNVQTHLLASEYDVFIKRHKLTADRVLVDAPCSGTGTWRRNPDLKWRFTAQDLQEVTQVQASILQSACRLVKPGGRLIYVTCSLLPVENEEQIEKFLKSVNNFKVVCAKKIWDKSPTINVDTPQNVSYLWLTPHQDGVDGFFAAVLERLPIN